MKKYKTEFKLKVVQSFLAGEGGAKLLARRWSAPEEKVCTWVSHYRLHGIDGLRPKRSAHTAQSKLQVLAHQDREQLSSRRIAAIYDMRNPNQVLVWRRNLDQDPLQASEGGNEEQPKMKPKRRSAALSSTVFADAEKNQRDEDNRLRAEVAYLKKIASLDPVEELSRADKARLIAGLRQQNKWRICRRSQAWRAACSPTSARRPSAPASKAPWRPEFALSMTNTRVAMDTGGSR